MYLCNIQNSICFICLALRRPSSIETSNTVRGVKVYVSLQFRVIDPPNTAKRFIRQNQNARLATAACAQMYENVWKLCFSTVSRDRPTESCEKVHLAKSKCAYRYSGVHSKKCTFRYSSVRENVWNISPTPAAARAIEKSPFHYSLGHPTSTKWRKGCFATWKICVPPQCWTPDEHEVARGLLRDVKICVSQRFWTSEVTRGLVRQVKNLHFATVLGVRRAGSDERVASAGEKCFFSLSFLFFCFIFLICFLPIFSVFLSFFLGKILNIFVFWFSFAKNFWFSFFLFCFLLKIFVSFRTCVVFPLR